MFWKTSLNMPGFSITLLLLPTKAEANGPSLDLLLSLLDEKPEVPGWKWASPTAPGQESNQIATAHQSGRHSENIKAIRVGNPNAFIQSIRRAAQAVINTEPEITRMDSIAGDGDCGLTLKVFSFLPFVIMAYQALC